ncbi:MAG: Hint domain-containing protein [Pseudomonadota bacterium]
MVTQLDQGDLIFTGFDSVGQDGFQFVTTVALEPGTRIVFTDGEFEIDVHDSGANGFSGSSGDDFLVWTVGDEVPQFGVVTILAENTDGSIPIVTVSIGGETVDPNTFDQGQFTSADPNLSPIVPGLNNTGGEGLFAFQGGTFEDGVGIVLDPVDDTIVTLLASGELSDAFVGDTDAGLAATGLTLFDPNDPDVVPTAVVIPEGSFAEFDTDDSDVGTVDTDMNGQPDTVIAGSSDGLRQLLYNPGNWAVDPAANGESNGIDPDAPFDSFEFAFACFSSGTLIATPAGPRAVEEIDVGDRVLTRDHGVQTVRWAGGRRFDRRTLAHNPHLVPIRIRAGALGDRCPERDLIVSPQHRMALSGWRVELLFGDCEVLVSAKSLVNDLTICPDQAADGVEYRHLLFDQHEIIVAEGAETESFHPGETAMSTLEADVQAEILEIFPELSEGIMTYGPTARPVLRRYEAASLFVETA